MPAHTSRVRALVLWTVWKFSPEFCTRANFPSSFRADLTTRALLVSTKTDLAEGGAKRSASFGESARLLNVLFCGFGLTLRPDGYERQSDQDSNRDFEETMKRNDPCSVCTRNEHDNGERDARIPIRASLHPKCSAQESQHKYSRCEHQSISREIGCHECAGQSTQRRGGNRNQYSRAERCLHNNHRTDRSPIRLG